jgi:N-dimethylarginine dimethylaminohydrolase
VKSLGVRCHPVPVATGAQHLLGGLCLVDEDLALSPAGWLSSTTQATLRELGIEVHELDCRDSPAGSQALDFVTIAPRKVVGGDLPDAIVSGLEECGIELVAMTATDELRKAAGGLACATAILDRTPWARSGIEAG